MAKAKTKKNIRHQSRELHESEADFWAFLTIAAFPLAMLIASSYGATPISSFLFGAYGSLAILVANYIADGKLWMFSPQWQKRFDHPEFSFRLAVISGAILLILETVLIVMLLTDSGMDRALLSMVFERQCDLPSHEVKAFCKEAGRLLYK